MPGERTATLSRCAPETSPCRTASRQSDGIDLLAEGRRSTGDAGGNRDPLQRWANLSEAASSQLVLGSSCGPPKRAMVQRIHMSSWVCSRPLRDIEPGAPLKRPVRTRMRPYGVVGSVARPDPIALCRRVPPCGHESQIQPDTPTKEATKKGKKINSGRTEIELKCN